MAEQSTCDLKSNSDSDVQEEAFSKQVIAYLQKIVDDPGLCDALHFFATGQINNKEIVLKIAGILVAIAPQFIKFPTEDELTETQNQFYKLSRSVNGDFGFPNIIGVVDCACVRYVQERESNINVQFVCGPDLQFYNVLAAFSGDNLQIWNNSKLRAQLVQQKSTDKCWLIGNAGYIQDSVLMCPVFEAKTAPERLYNCSHNIVYKCIKRALYLLKKRFKCLDIILCFSPQEVCAITIACCVLHNICIRHCDYNIDYNYLLLIADLDTTDEMRAVEKCDEEDTSNHKDVIKA